MINKRSRIHFIGIGGSGMSPIAGLCADMGYVVSGSDQKGSDKLEALRRKGIAVMIGHLPENAEGKDLVVYSAAVPHDNPELMRARELRIPVIPRSRMLGMIFNDKFGIGVAGTHGKTTTSSMISVMLELGGLDPTIIVGGEITDLGLSSKLGASEYVVAEADEAYGSFLHLEPEMAVVTNIDDDHRDYYKDFEGILNGFKQYLSNVKPGGLIIYCGENRFISGLVNGIDRERISYGISPGYDFYADSIKLNQTGSSFDLIRGGERLGEIDLKVPGTHNVGNAIAASIVGLRLGLSFRQVGEGLAAFHGAARRGEVIGVVNDIRIMDDYAHHPTEIKATLKALKDGTGRRIIAVFQPQRYTRTKLLWNEFAGAFVDADIVLINEIYYKGTGEEPIPGISGEALTREIERVSQRTSEFYKDMDSIVERLIEIGRPGDVVITMGAGDIRSVSLEYMKRIKEA